MIVKLAEGNLKTLFGEFQETLYYDGQKESIAMTMGDVRDGQEVLCRIHSSCIYGHVFNSVECDCRQQMESSQKLVQEAGKGIIIWLDQEGKGNGHYALLKSIAFKREGMQQAQAYQAAGFQADARNFKVAADILNHLGVKSIRLLTDNPRKIEMLSDYGVEVTSTVSTTL